MVCGDAGFGWPAGRGGRPASGRGRLRDRSSHPPPPAVLDRQRCLDYRLDTPGRPLVSSRRYPVRLEHFSVFSLPSVPLTATAHFLCRVLENAASSPRLRPALAAAAARFAAATAAASGATAEEAARLAQNLQVLRAVLLPVYSNDSPTGAVLHHGLGRLKPARALQLVQATQAKLAPAVPPGGAAEGFFPREMEDQHGPAAATSPNIPQPVPPSTRPAPAALPAHAG